MSILSRKRKKKRYMRYTEALQAMKAYQNNELKLEQVLDLNKTSHMGRSVGGGRCQISGCNQWIRWEYHLKSKITGDVIAVGSTCVWTMLELSKEQIKEFEKTERVIKDFHKMLEWRAGNMDVWKKIKEAKNRKIMSLELFWEEVEYAALDVEDTDYIRNLDLEKEEKRWIAEKEKKERMKADKSYVRGKGEPPDGYDKVLKALEALIKKNPGEGFYKSLKEASDRGTLSDKQIISIKIATNKMYFNEVVKKDPEIMREYNECDKEVENKFLQYAKDRKLRIYVGDRGKLGSDVSGMVRKYRKQFHDLMGKDKKWKLYRLKHNIVLH